MSTPGTIDRQASVQDNNTEVLPIDVGQTIWIPGTNDSVWEHGTVMAIGELKVTVRSASGKVQQVDRGLALPMNPRITDDMTSLYYIHEAGVLHNLDQRSALKGKSEDKGPQRPYTFMANVLIAVNPLQPLENPKAATIINNSSCDPHPYAIAEMAYTQMVYNSTSEMPTNQSVVISGESGAGKTESSKIVLKHLTTRGVFGKAAKAADVEKSIAAHEKDDSSSLDRRLIEQNPILEAFGNAKTLRNHNSSRFGKFMKLQFTNDGNFKLAGAFVETYLLEKSRLVYQVEGERNFHIFYQLLKGANTKQKSEYKLLAPEGYRYLNQSGCYAAQEIDDSKCFQEVITGLTCVGITAVDQHDIFGIVAALLFLGNIVFDNEDTGEGEAAIISPTEDAKSALTMAAQLLSVDSSYLFKVIGEREIVTREETFTVRRNAQNAVYARDAIAKSIYGRLFDWIIQRVNVSLGQDPAPLPFIGVLDIFGFESFQRNDFEQLLINYTNEVLQATFNNQVFIAEMELYKREGITVGKIEWPDNRECVELIASKTSGILQILDNEAMNPKPSDVKFLAMLHRTHGKNKYFPRPHPKDMREIFIVRHFAGAVSYTIGAFMDKNNDTIPSDLSDLFLSSKSSIMTSLFEEEAKEKAAANAKTGASRRPKKKLKSVAAKFSRQMNELVDTLDATRCNFIRCIKPNAMMKLGYFDPRYVVGQLRCQGIMQTAQVLKVGLPTRVSYMELTKAYKPHMPPDTQRLFSQQSDPTLITAILWAFAVPQDCFKLGITKLFFKAGKIAILDGILKINWTTDGPKIVKRMKLWLARRRWRVALAKVQSQIRWTKLLKRIRFRSNSVAKLQQWWRGFSIRRTFLKKKASATVIQSRYRGYRARKAFKERKHEMVALAAQRAETAKADVIEAKRKQEAALAAAEVARKQEGMEAEAAQAEAEARDLARLANEAVAEADMAIAAASAAVEAEKNAEKRAEMEANELEARMKGDRAAAEDRKQAALLNASALSASVLGGLAQFTTMTGANGAAVQVVEVPSSLGQENKEQLAQLNDLLVSGAIAQTEYDELVPFLVQEEAPADALTAEQQVGLDRLYSEGVYGVQIRCPVCGENNNTANGNSCTSCAASLTTNDSNSRSTEHQYYGSRARSSQRDLSGLVNGPGTFKVDSAQRILIHDGYFQAEMHGTQILADENYAEYTVYVLRCGWQPEGGDPAYWMVAHRYSVFERLHKDLKLKIPAHVATLPTFPKKHRLGGVFTGKTGNSNEVVNERKAGLAKYIHEVVEMCARLPDTLSVPELDRFLNLSASVQQLKATNESGNAEGGAGRQSERLVGGPEGLAERESNRPSTELPNPLDADELTQTEQALAMFDNAIRTSNGDLRRNQQVQHLLKLCVKLQPRLQMSATIDNPFADIDLIPRAMQCQEDLEHTMGLYNDSLLAATTGAAPVPSGPRTAAAPPAPATTEE